MLHYLALNRNRLVTKRELLNAVWPDTHVTEDLIKDYVRKIRRLLQDDPKEPRFIETARGLGYRFIGDIMVSETASRKETVAGETRPLPVIAVLPFSDSSDSGEQTYFSAGIAEDIIAELSRFRSLRVIARDSSFLYGAQPEAVDRLARELTTQYLLQGRVRKVGQRVRIHARLIEAANGICLWAERYDRELTDIFSLQDEVSRAIVSTIVGRLDELGRQRAARKSPTTLMAYERILLGTWHLRQGSRGDILTARRLFEQTIEREPTNARAHAEMAFSYLLEFWSEWTTSPEAAVGEALTLARKAVALDGLDSRARIYLAAAYHYGEANFTLAEAEYNKAIELNPNDYDGFCLKSWLLALSGRALEGAACAEEAIRLSPLTTEDCRLAQFMGAYSARRYDEALAALFGIQDPSYDSSAFLAMCYAQLGRVAEAKQAMARYLAAAARKIEDYPGTDRDRWRRYWATRYPFKNTADFEHLMEGLHKAGLP